MHVGGARGERSQLPALARARRVHLGHGLALQRRRRDLGAQDYVADLGRRERRDAHVVLLAVVVEDQVLERYLGLDPVVAGEGRPDVVWLGGHFARGLENLPRFLVVHVQCSF